MSAAEHRHDHHGHDHHHHHHDEPDHDFESLEASLDPGNRALADALRKVFVVLKIVMVCVVGLFIYGGMFNVEQNEVALVLRFGQVKGATPDQAILEPGLHWRWPYIDEVVRIPAASTKRQLDVDSFWYFQTEEEKAGIRSRPVGRQLQFARDGYTLTASRGAAAVTTATDAAATATDKSDVPITDYNIVHTQWRVRYSVTDPISFFENLWDGRSGVSNDDSGWFGVERVVRCALADAVIITSANRDIEWMIWDRPRDFSRDVADRFRDRLAELGSGLDASLELIEIVPPRQVKPAFDLAASANTRAEQLAVGARAQAQEVVSAAQADRDVIVAEAQAYATRVVEAARADGRYLETLLAKVDQAVRQRVPDDAENAAARRAQLTGELLAVTVDELYQEALRAVVANADEVMVLNATEGASVEWRPMLSRDPQLKAAPKRGAEGRLYVPQPSASPAPGPM